MNKFLIIIVTVLILLGAFFGYRYYQSSTLTKEVNKQENENKETVKSINPQKEVDYISKITEEINIFLSKNNRNIGNIKNYPYIKDGKTIVVAGTYSENSASECIFLKENNVWSEVGCHQNLLPCDLLDKAGMDRQSTIGYKCFDYDKQEYRISDSSNKNSIIFKEDKKYIEINDLKNKYSIKFANDMVLDITDTFNGYNREKDGQKLNEKTLSFNKTGESFRLNYFPEYITPERIGWGGGLETLFTIESFSGKTDINKIYSTFSGINEIEQLSIKGKKAFKFSSPSAASGILHTVIEVNENHYIIFSTYWGDNKTINHNKLYYEMIDSLNFN
jgi:hypothetical protein